MLPYCDLGNRVSDGSSGPECFPRYSWSDVAIGVSLSLCWPCLEGGSPRCQECQGKGGDKENTNRLHTFTVAAGVKVPGTALLAGVFIWKGKFIQGKLTREKKKNITQVIPQKGKERESAHPPAVSH